jgi:hypothetical protein
MAGGMDQNRVHRRNLLPNYYQKLTSGFAAEPWGIAPFHEYVKALFCGAKPMQLLTYA